MKGLWIISIILLSYVARAQDNETHFKDTRVVNGYSTEVERKGYLKFIISHRFGAFNNDFLGNFFGLDNAEVRLGLDYGLTKNLTIGAGRSTLNKAFDGYLKWKICNQKQGVPVTITLLNSLVYRTLDNLSIPDDDTPINRLSYSYEAYFSRLFGDRLAVQLSPILTYRNLVTLSEENHMVYTQGLTIGYKLTQKVAINLEYFYTPDGQNQDITTNPLSLGIDFGTSGHVFQLFFSNAQAVTSPYFVNSTTGNWLDGDIFFGFNISRAFRIKAYK